jgi:glycosyltransferase involved in cell wall biosynthesis
VNLSEEQARQGADVTVLTVETGAEPWVRPSTSLVTSKCFPMTLPLRNPGISIQFARELRKNINTFDFAHIHAIWNFPTYYTMRSAFAGDVPYMVAPQGSLEPWALKQNRWGKRFYGLLTEKPLLKRATCLQAVSSVEANQIKSFGIKAPTVIIPNGVDASLLERKAATPLTAKLGLGDSQKTLLYLSRLHPKKGVDMLIRAFSRIPESERLTLVVGGSDAGSGFGTKLKELAHELGVGSRCLFVGEVKGGEKHEMLLGADFFALPSHSEGLPVAVIEAMASGLPVLITPGCNLPEVEEWRAGRILLPEVCEFAQGLLETVRDPERAREMGLAGRRLVKAKFTWERIARETLGIYQAAVLTRTTGEDGRAPR